MDRCSEHLVEHYGTKLNSLTKVSRPTVFQLERGKCITIWDGQDRQGQSRVPQRSTKMKRGSAGDHLPDAKKLKDDLAALQPSEHREFEFRISLYLSVYKFQQCQ